MVQPVNVNLPLTGPKGYQVVVTHDNHGEKLIQQRENGRKEVQRVVDLLDEVGTYPCPECWIFARVNPQAALIPSHRPGKHPVHPRYAETRQALTLLEFPKYVHWSFCYRCWRTFDPPFGHPQHERGAAILREKCQYEATLADLVGLIYAAGDERTSFHAVLADRLGNSTEVWTSVNGFCRWLVLDCKDASTIPNVYQFILAFDDVYPRR